jgi:thymidylate synthase
MSTGFSIPFADIYRNLLVWALNSPEEVNERTGKKVRVGRGGTSFRLDLSDELLPTCGLRKTFPKSAAAEVAWYLSGVQDVTWMRQHAPFWDKFVEADGKTIKSAYGYRWREHFGRDQIQLAIDALRANSSDRRVYVSAWDPSEDGLGADGQRNVPCPVAFNFHVQGGELHSTMTLRSSDLFVGLPYDVMGHALLMATMAASIGVRPGVMQVAICHAHLYEVHYDMAAKAVAQRATCPELYMPRWTVEEIELRKDSYVNMMGAAQKQHQWPSYSPRPDVVE